MTVYRPDMSFYATSSIVAEPVAPSFPVPVLLEPQEEEETETKGSSAANDTASSYMECPEVASSVRPSLDGVSLDFTGFNISDTFIHKENHEEFLHGDYTLHPNKTIPLLPDTYETIAGNHKFNSCAVVGNSGHLKFSQFGQAIDSHDVVLRLNQSPNQDFGQWAGTKTTIRLINSLWTNRYAKYGTGRNRDLPLEENLTILVSRTNGEAFDRIFERMRKRRPDVTVLQLNSRIVSAARRALTKYRIKLCQHGHGPYEGGLSPSSGLVAVYMLHTVCKRVTTYGLGTVDVPDVPYHYFQGKVGFRTEGTSVHSFDAESALLDAMAFENKIEQCKYLPQDAVPHEKQVISSLKTNFTELQQHQYSNRFCGWNLCNRRSFRKLGRMVESRKDLNFNEADCKKIMFNE